MLGPLEFFSSVFGDVILEASNLHQPLPCRNNGDVNAFREAIIAVVDDDFPVLFFTGEQNKKKLFVYGE